ncbi:hypothetical protein B0H12DRAFT_1229793 [Mycena haematopus]|nr:hypothetical protein B0H12DRAFT_1229793 [Mycena haematopus]
MRNYEREPQYGYIEDMVDDPEYCQHVVNPVPTRLMDVILPKKRRELAAKKKEHKGERVTQINPRTRPPVVIPDMFLVAMKFKLHPGLALSWFADKRLRFAEENPRDLPTKKNGISGNKAVLDIVKLKATWIHHNMATKIIPLSRYLSCNPILQLCYPLSCYPENLLSHHPLSCYPNIHPNA